MTVLRDARTTARPRPAGGEHSPTSSPGARRLNVLFASLGLPYPPTNGHRIRRWSLLRALAGEGHQVTLVSFAENQEEAGAAVLRSVCEAVELVPISVPNVVGNRDRVGRLRALVSAVPYAASRFRSPALRDCIARQLEWRRFDAVVCDEIYAFPNLPNPSPVPVLLDTLHVAHVILAQYMAQERHLARRAYARLEYWKTRRWEIAVCSRATELIACSELERLALQRLCPNVPVVTVPNAVDVGAHTPGPDPGGATVLYTGGMDWYPNRDAVEFFARAILPELRRLVPDAVFRVAGRSPAPEFRRRLGDVPGLEFTGTVPDMQPEIARATVCVVPLRIGSGTRLKILEAAAMAKPVVSTRLGAEGLEFVEGEEILLADHPATFARLVAELLADAPRRLALGTAARSRVERRNSLPILQGALREALERVSA